MANYHFEVSVISRGKGRSLAKSMNYITGQRVKDAYWEKTYYNRRRDVLFTRVYLPSNAPPELKDMQFLCDEIEKSEKRYDARTAREFKCSLPNELPIDELEKIVSDFICENFISQGICAVAAIHEGRNDAEAEKNNPHVHIIVATRTVDENGFSRKKCRDFDKRDRLLLWRKQWEKVLNRAYERNKLPEKVSCESLEVQGIIDIEPTIHLSRIDWQKEKRGERTLSGDIKREIAEKNKERLREKEKNKSRKKARYLYR